MSTETEIDEKMHRNDSAIASRLFSYFTWNLYWTETMLDSINVAKVNVLKSKCIYK